MKEVMRTSRFFTLLLCFISWTVTAQEKTQDPCATMDQDRASRAKFPQRGSLIEFEDFIGKKMEEIRVQRASGRMQAGVITIPVIVHVVHNGENPGAGANIPQAQVQSQLEVLNEDFRRKPGTRGFNDSPVGADIEIEFCLSFVDENGQTMEEPGIDRVDGNQADWTRDQIENKLKPNTYWDPNKFFNIWTVNFANDADHSRLLGYAQFPDQSNLPGLQEQGGPATTDGVVLRYNVFGSTDKGDFTAMTWAPNDKGRTLTHETGHWLGLRHIWGDGNCAEDFVSDTPPAASESFGCQVGRISCGGVNMVQNYMDYSNDACMNIFTQGQKDRMLAVMEVSPRRKTLLENNFCNPVVADVPVANFTLEQAQCILLGSEVEFTDLSTNFPSEWSWTFEGGDPATSNEKNPDVVYNSPGVYDVTLIVTNTLGSDTLKLEDFIVVSEEGLCSNFNNFKPGYTPSVLEIGDFEPAFSGYLTGHSTANNRAFSEYFSNNCGYKYISGVAIDFAALSIADEDTKVTVTVWNARGRQNSPGAVLERKEVHSRQIIDDIANNRLTEIVFDRETPLFSRPFHVGVELSYFDGSRLAIRSSANEEATNATSWVQHADGEWELFTIAYGANIAMNIEAHVGINPSVQVSASKLLVYPGEEVVLNGRGASIFVWSSDDGNINDVAGPQLIVNPVETTTYTTVGSGLDLCQTVATTTIYAREEFVDAEDEQLNGMQLFPNPSKGRMTVSIDNSYTGAIRIGVESAVGQTLTSIDDHKTQHHFERSIDTSDLRSGLYFVRVEIDGKVRTLKWMKL
jgi:PKD repeat protein